MEKDFYKFQNIFDSVVKTKEKLKSFEEERNYKNKYLTRKESYIKRNEEMINDSDFCVFF